MSRKDTALEIKAKLKQLKKMLPKGFAKKCVARLKEKGIEVTENAVYQVTSFKSQNSDIIKELAQIVIDSRNEVIDILDEALNVNETESKIEIETV